MISNIYYLFRKTAKHEKVIGNLKKRLEIIDVVIVDKTTVIAALNSDFKDFEDALQNYSIENKNDIKIIVTRNIKDYKMSNLSIMTPETFLKTI